MHTGFNGGPVYYRVRSGRGAPNQRGAFLLKIRIVSQENPNGSTISPE